MSKAHLAAWSGLIFWHVMVFAIAAVSITNGYKG